MGYRYKKYNVILIEARSRAGGRVRTYRDPFADNLYAEMGAEYVDSTDNLVHEYCKDFGLKVLNFGRPSNFFA